MTQQRVDCYTTFCDARGYPPALAMAGDWCFGVWILGNNYRSKQGYHGKYPPGYLPRIAALFPAKRRVLHLLSGDVDLAALPGDTCDLHPDLCPTFVADAHTLEGVPLEQYDLVVAGPRYSGEDADRYGSSTATA